MVQYYVDGVELITKGNIDKVKFFDKAEDALREAYRLAEEAIAESKKKGLHPVSVIFDDESASFTDAEGEKYFGVECTNVREVEVQVEVSKMSSKNFFIPDLIRDGEVEEYLENKGEVTKLLEEADKLSLGEASSDTAIYDLTNERQIKEWDEV